MKTVKSYFNEDNALNKGYNKDIASKKFIYSKIDPEIMPDNDDEVIDKDLAKKFLEMAQKEQEHHHNLEKCQLRSSNIAKYFGYVCGVISVGIIAFFSFLIVNISVIIAIIFIVFGFGAIFGVSIISRFLKVRTFDNTQLRNKNNFYNRNKQR
jgi:uncharacterized membrane protein